MDQDILLDIAKRHFHSVETLTIQNSDRLDFHDVAVWSIASALEEAYLAGKRSTATQPVQTAVINTGD